MTPIRVHLRLSAFLVLVLVFCLARVSCPRRTSYRHMAPGTLRREPDFDDRLSEITSASA